MLRAGRQPERLGLVEELGWTPRVAALLVKPWRVAAHAVAFQDAIGDHSGLVGDQDLGFAVGERRQQRGAAELVTAARRAGSRLAGLDLARQVGGGARGPRGHQARGHGHHGGRRGLLQWRVGPSPVGGPLGRHGAGLPGQRVRRHQAAVGTVAWGRGR